MANPDYWAVIVAIQDYPGISNLEGPLNDAREFKSWVTSDQGGNVPPLQVFEVLSPNPVPQPFDVLSAIPTGSQVQEAFERVHFSGEKPGKRLYIYLAGHGIEPASGQPAILMANAAEHRYGYHILGRAYADWFFHASAFSEILLFMDCCRDNYPAAHLSLVPWEDDYYPDSADNVKYLYTFATKWSQRSRERTIPPGNEKRGVFTYALLEGLKGAASRPDGFVTAASLQDYLNDNVKRFLDPADLNAPGVPQQPDIERNPQNGEGFVIVQVPPKRYSVAIGLPSPPAGPPILFELKRGEFDEALRDFPQVVWGNLTRVAGSGAITATVQLAPGAAPEVAPAVDIATQQLRLALSKGTYLAQVMMLALQRPFVVPSQEIDGHVEFNL